jgi:hypothetical protein
MRKILLLLLFGLATSLVYTQTPSKVDSMLNLLSKTNRDTNAVKLYLKIGDQYETNKPEIAKQYYRKAKTLSNK